MSQGLELFPDAPIHISPKSARRKERKFKLADVDVRPAKKAKKTKIKLKTTKEALAALREARHELIAGARMVAHELIKLTGSTYSRAVRNEMKKRGMLKVGVADYWLGNVFNVKHFRWSGEWVTPPVPEGTTANVHAWRPCKIWMAKLD